MDSQLGVGAAAQHTSMMADAQPQNLYPMRTKSLPLTTSSPYHNVAAGAGVGAPSIRKSDTDAFFSISPPPMRASTMCGGETGTQGLSFARLVLVLFCVASALGMFIGLESHFLFTTLLGFGIFVVILFGTTILLCDLQLMVRNDLLRMRSSGSTSPRVFVA